MHRQEYINIINEAATKLAINLTHFSDNWAIKLSKAQVIKFIVGYTFPLNNSACYKIARNKNLCSEILTANGIPNVPHYLLYSPSVLKRRGFSKGNREIIEDFLSKHGYPFVIKKNNSSRGDGVYFITTEPEMEDILAKVYTTDSTLCFSPYRSNIQEYRNIILNGNCLLSYEKQRPFVLGNGKSTLLELLSAYQQTHDSFSSKSFMFDDTIVEGFNSIPGLNERVYFHWKHNNAWGINYHLVEIEEMKTLAITAAEAIDANFVSVDVVYSRGYGFEVLEINASVVIHMFASQCVENYQKAVAVFTMALQDVFKA
jgi:glutathione synthase/RimK-type ligase-like ATP-grasp enzyme